MMMNHVSGKLVLASVLMMAGWAAPLMAAEISITLPDAPALTQSCALAFDAEATPPFAGEDVFYLNETGEPAIPWKMLFVLLSPEADLAGVTVQATQATYAPVDGVWNLSPTPPMATRTPEDVEFIDWPAGVDRQTGEKVAIYQNNAFWPVEAVRLAEAGQMRTYKLARIAVPLARYNPVTGEVQLLDNIEIALTYDTELRAAPAGEAAASADGRRDAIGREMVAPLAANFDAMADRYESSAAAADEEGAAADPLIGYTIITTNYIVNNSTALANFVAHKQLLYYDVQVITETQFGGGTGDTAAENIRNWLKNHYLTDNIKYVLLIGNPHPTSGDIPMKMTWPRYDEEDARDAPTDLYFSELTGDWDLDNDGIYGEPVDVGTSGASTQNEVIVGRIPYYGSLTDLNSILQKTINYERQAGAAINWRTNCLLPMEPSDDDTPGYHLGEAIKNNFLTPKGWNYCRIYEETYGLNPAPEITPCNETNVRNAWSTAPYYGMVIWWTHGGSTGASDVFSTSSVPYLNNNYPSITFQVSCTNAHPETTNNLAYSILRNGGIATNAATRVSWYSPGQTSFNNTTSNSGMSYEYAERILNNQMAAGEALADLKYDLWASRSWCNFLVFNLYGDPSVSLEPTYYFPTITPPSGEYYPSVTAEASFPDPAWTIYYTTDGSDPESDDAVYSGPLTFTEDTILKVRAFDSSPILLDIIDKDYAAAQYIEPGFTGWAPYSNASITVKGVTITRSGISVDNFRTIPDGTPGKAMYQDSFFGSISNGLDLTISGLVPSAQYEISFYCYDHDTLGKNHIETLWYANGVLAFTVIYDEGVLPTSLDTYKWTAIVTSDASGEILFDSVQGAGCDVTSYWASISGMEIYPLGVPFVGDYSAIVTAQYDIIPGEIFVDDDAPNDPGAGDPLVSDPLEDGSAEHPFDAIQEAMDLAVSGVTVTVLPGTYTGTGNRNIDFNGKNIILRSTAPTNPQVVAATVIDCENLGRGLLLDNSETSDTQVQGLTIANGYASSGGGGIYCYRSSPVIENCRVVNCTSGSHGGGVFTDGGAMTLQHSSIRGCTTTYGGGIYAKGNAHPTVLNCVLANNTAGSGGAVCVVSANMTFEQVTLANNAASSFGGMVYAMTGNLSWLNGIVWGNTSPTGATAYLTSSSTAAFDYCDVQNGASGFYLSGAGNSYTLSTGCFDMDPLFADAANGDYHLQSAAGRWDEAANDWVTDTQTSPVIDTAHPSQGIGEEPADAANVRKNLGAYGGTAEASRTPLNWSVGCDVNNDGAVDLAELSLLAQQWQQTGSGLVSDYEGNGSVTITDLLLLCEDWLGTPAGHNSF